ncbi:MAG: RNA methyltransferase [Bacteroidota bacterium]|jgi:tRNA (guanosine-2'-O-)-methyltransferase|nr:MAG: rRNA methyltransferase [Bacteroidota bacterium]
MLSETERLVLQHLAQYVTDHKKEFITKVLSQRTRRITVVLEDVYQSQNLSAVMRTCECMGIQDVHVIENTSGYGFNKKVLKGAHKWLTIQRYRTGDDRTRACITSLREKGYRILAVSPDPSGIPIDAVTPDEPLALVFGNELHGLSDAAIALGDQQVTIPMYGFTESMNISVSAALCVYVLSAKLRTSGLPYGLTEDEQDELRLKWYRKIVRRSDVIEREYLRTIT